MALKLFEKIKEKKKEKSEITVRSDATTFVKDEFHRRLDERRAFELQWRLNLSMIEGNQQVEINTVCNEITDTPDGYWWEERESFNHIGPLIETRLARLVRMTPVMKTRPQSDDPEHLRAAKVGSSLLKNAYYKQGLRKKMRGFITWMESTGTCVMKNVWNPNLGPLTLTAEEIEYYGLVSSQSPGDSSLLKHFGEQLDKREGDYEGIVCPPFEILPDSCYNEEVSDCTSIIHARSYHIDTIEEIWGVEVTAEPVSAMKLSHASVSQGGLGYAGTNFQFSAVTLEKYASVIEYWEMPTRKFPSGRLILVCGDELLYYDRLPYPVGEDGSYALPFAKACSIKRPGVFWGKSVVERAIPVQRRYNSVRNKKAEFLKRAAIGNWMIQEGSVDLDDFEGGVGAAGYICVVKRGFDFPKAMDPGRLPGAEFQSEEQTLMSEFNIFTGVSDLSKQSTAPPGVKSGVALSLAMEQDDTRISLTATNVEEMLCETGRHVIRLYRHFASGSRVLREIGKNNVVELIDWTGEDLKSDDVVVEASSTIADSPAQRRQMVFDLIGAGLLFDPDTGRIDRETRAQVFELIEFGNWEDANSSDKLHTAKADRENMKALQGVESVPVVYDDHIVHLWKHNDFRLTSEYEALVADDPEIDEMMQMHVDIHLMFMAPNKGTYDGAQDAMDEEQAGAEATAQGATDDLAPSPADGELTSGGAAAY